jgi:hypothetical protein
MHPELETFTFLNEFTKETSDTFVTKPRAEYMKRMKETYNGSEVVTFALI